jgi:hypothetical protein
MSSSVEAVSASEPSTCPRCARLYHPPDADGCWACRRLRERQPRVLASEESPDALDRAEEAEADTYDFLDAFYGHPDAD